MKFAAFSKRSALATALLATALGCSGGSGGNIELTYIPPQRPCSYELEGATSPQAAQTLRINEVMTGNDGAWVDEVGETDDFVELINTGTKPVLLSDYALGDKVGKAMSLPEIEVGAGQTVLLWADDTEQQGPLHLSYKLSNSGTPVLLWGKACELVDQVTVPELPRSESYARLPDGDGDFSVCRYATPERVNGESCEPPPPANLQDNVLFAPYDWEQHEPLIAGPLALSQLALRPANFVEVTNISAEAVALSAFSVRISPMEPGDSWPAADEGAELGWPDGAAVLEPGERLRLPVVPAETAELEANEEFEGVASVWAMGAESPSDRIDFMAWPDGAALVRAPVTAAPRYCQAPTPDGADECEPLAGRALPHGRVHRLETPEDFATLAAGGTEVGEAVVKFVIDMDAGDVVHLLGSREWALHYSWIREAIEGLPRLDRCDPVQALEFNEGWGLFSQDEYFRVEGRRYLLGSLVAHTNGMKTVEFTPGDAIVGEQMRRAFFAVTRYVEDRTEWAIRPTEGRQVNELRRVEGTVPAVGPNAPYKGLSYQPLNPAVGFGTLVFVPAHELETAQLGPNVIVVTDDVPNETAFMGGLITEAFQTPLAHVNVLARGRNTPNMALRGARQDARLKELFGKLVRLEVRATDFQVREASAAEADEYWQARTPNGPKLMPVRDLSVTGVVPLDGASYAVGAAAGSKAAGMAELYQVQAVGTYCPSTTVPLFVPPGAFALPFAHYTQHFQDSGAAELLAMLEQDPEFRADPALHGEGLAQVRQLMLDHPVDDVLLAEVEKAIGERFGSNRVRFRSSSNTEDLATFNGAGLHTSTSADIDGSSSTVEDALRQVWASLWNTRAYDERAFGNVEQSLAAMAVLVHQAWQSEAAQGVAISRNALHATRDSQYYINAQIGEASVTNPAPGVTSDELVYTPPPRRPRVDFQTRSSLSRGRDVLTFAEIQALGCALQSIHEHYRPLVDPDEQNRLYAMQIEWKLIGPERRLLVKQARPYSFGAIDAPTDCREF